MGTKKVFFATVTVSAQPLQKHGPTAKLMPTPDQYRLLFGITLEIVGTAKGRKVFKPKATFSMLSTIKTSTAIANVDPPETPVIIPSFLANSCDQYSPSSPETGINSS